MHNIQGQTFLCMDVFANHTKSYYLGGTKHSRAAQVLCLSLWVALHNHSAARKHGLLWGKMAGGVLCLNLAESHIHSAAPLGFL